MPFIVEADKYPFYGEWNVESGETLSDVIQARNDIVLSRNLADDLKAEVGDMVRLSGASEDFVVRALCPPMRKAALRTCMARCSATTSSM